jgi:predicted RNase H-like nuclease (RuvC/YqgF family)
MLLKISAGINGLLLVLLVIGGMAHYSELGIVKYQLSNAKVSISELNNTVFKLTNDISLCKSVNDNFKQSVDSQNKSFESIKEASSNQSKVNKELIAKTRAHISKLEVKYSELFKLPKKFEQDECSSLDYRLKQYLTMRGTNDN